MRSRQRVGHLRIRDKPDPFPMPMRVSIEHLGELLHVESSEPISIGEALGRLGIPTSTVLAVHEGAILPHTSVIKSDFRIELVVVSSGG